jgi:hypothetical protein
VQQIPPGLLRAGSAAGAAQSPFFHPGIVCPLLNIGRPRARKFATRSATLLCLPLKFVAQCFKGRRDISSSTIKASCTHANTVQASRTSCDCMACRTSVPFFVMAQLLSLVPRGNADGRYRFKPRGVGSCRVDEVGASYRLRSNS